MTLDARYGEKRSILCTGVKRCSRGCSPGRVCMSYTVLLSVYPRRHEKWRSTIRYEMRCVMCIILLRNGRVSEGDTDITIVNWDVVNGRERPCRNFLLVLCVFICAEITVCSWFCLFYFVLCCGECRGASEFDDRLVSRGVAVSRPPYACM